MEDSELGLKGSIDVSTTPETTNTKLRRKAGTQNPTNQICQDDKIGMRSYRSCLLEKNAASDQGVDKAESGRNQQEQGSRR